MAPGDPTHSGGNIARLRRVGVGVTTDAVTPQQPLITVYWRPGCGFCAGLLGRLESTDLIYETVNIWNDDEARARVRAAAGGNETVPTVAIGDVTLVNPSIRAVLDAVAGSRPTRRRFRR